MIVLNSTEIGLIVAGSGKIFIEVADAMPPLEPGSGYFARWIYAFMQRLASNGMKAEAARNGSTGPVALPTTTAAQLPELKQAVASAEVAKQEQGKV